MLVCYPDIDDYCNFNCRRLNSFDMDIGLIMAAEKLSMDILDVSWPLKLEAEFVSNGLAKIFCSEDFDFRPLRAASCALRRERRDRDWIEVVVVLPPPTDEKHANEEQLFYL